MSHRRNVVIWSGLLVLACAVAHGDDEPSAAAVPSGDTAKEVPAAPRAGTSSPSRPQAGSVSAPRPASRSVKEIGPPVYWLPDHNGDLQPVINWPFEAFSRLRDLQQGLAAAREPPAYSLLEITAEGESRGAFAELNVRLKIRVDTDHWIKVPLRLDEATMRGRETYRGPGEHVLRVDPSSGGYVLWLKGQSDQPHGLTLTVLVPLKKVGRQRSFRLTVPSSTSSLLKLHVAETDIEAEASGGATVDQIGDASAGGTMLQVLGLRDHFQLEWRPRPQRNVELPVELEAVGQLLARVDSRSISTVADLHVRSRGAPLNRFRVRLPVGARLVAGSAAEYHIEPLSATDQKGESAPVVEVQLIGEPRNEINVRLVTEQSHNPADTDQFVDLAGFDVLGAVRQSGYLAITALGDWQLVWGRRRSVRQVSIPELPKALESRDLTAGFEYLNQPAVLEVRITPRKSRVGIEPQYVFLVDADRVTLHARLKYTIRGARVFAIQVQLPEIAISTRRADQAKGDVEQVDDKNETTDSGRAMETPGWEIAEIGPPSLVDLEDISFDALTEKQPLSVTLLQPAVGEVEITLRAHLPLAPGTDSMSITLPNQPVNTVGPASVIIVPADNVELASRRNKIQGLSRASSIAEVDLPLRQQPALFFRGRADGARFSADFHIRRREVTARLVSRIHLKRDGGDVQQRLQYEIAYEPLDAIKLDVPRRLAEPGKLDVRISGQPVTPMIPHDTSAKGKDLADRAILRLPLSRPRVGGIEVTLRYALPRLDLPKEANVAVDVPLALPAEGNVLEQLVRVAADPGIHVGQRGDAWSPVSDDNDDRPSDEALALATSTAAARIRLVASLENTVAVGSTTIDRLWVQSWLGKTRRQDRAVFHCTATARSLTVRLPSGVDEKTLEVLLDGNVASVTLSGKQLKIDLPEASTERGREVELRYRFQTPRPRWGRLDLESIGFDDRVTVRRAYWQLVLPPDEHLVVGGDGFTSEQTWLWKRFYWGRQPLLGQFQLESWVDAPHRTAPSRGTNRYLFSSLAMNPNLRVVTAARWVLVLAASGVALIVGLMLIYAPAARRPGWLLAAALLISSVGILYPDPTVLVAQAASFGLLLTLFARLLQRATASVPPVPRMPSGGSHAEKGSTASRRLRAGSDEPTETRYTSLQGSASASK